jgi:hypothetical protein
MKLHPANNTLSILFLVGITIIVSTIISFMVFTTFIDQPSIGESGVTAGVSVTTDIDDQTTTIIWVSNHNVEEIRVYENGELYCDLSEVGQSCSITHSQNTTQTITVFGVTETGKIGKLKEVTI